MNAFYIFFAVKDVMGDALVPIWYPYSDSVSVLFWWLAEASGRWLELTICRNDKSLNSKFLIPLLLDFGMGEVSFGGVGEAEVSRIQLDEIKLNSYHSTLSGISLNLEMALSLGNCSAFFPLRFL